jgi:hypothetical protein
LGLFTHDVGSYAPPIRLLGFGVKAFKGLAEESVGLADASHMTMNSSEPWNPVDVFQRIKQEIERLTREQSEALKSATFVGMTPNEAKEYDDRRKKITCLVEELRLLKDAP